MQRDICNALRQKRNKLSKIKDTISVWQKLLGPTGFKLSQCSSLRRRSEHKESTAAASAPELPHSGPFEDSNPLSPRAQCLSRCWPTGLGPSLNSLTTIVNDVIPFSPDNSLVIKGG